MGLENEMRFVFESGPDPEKPFFIDSQIVGDLFRVSDIMFMPSLREGFGMPVLEAGLGGLPIASTDVPAAVEIAPDEVFLFSAKDPPETVAEGMLDFLENNPTARLRRRIRGHFTWQAIFTDHILPLLGE